MRFPLRHDNHAILLKATTRIASDGLSHRKPSITAVLRSQPFFSSLAAKRPKPRPRRASVCKTSIPSRGKKTKTTVKLKELPQGLIPLEPQLTENENEESSPYSTVITQVRSNMRKFANCVVLTRVGGFYELYFEHAEEFGPLLNLKVAERRTKRNTAAPVSMVSLLIPPFLPPPMNCYGKFMYMHILLQPQFSFPYLIFHRLVSLSSNLTAI